MAQIDSSIYFQQQAPDLIGAVKQGLAMRDSLDQRAQQQRAASDAEKLRQAEMFARIAPSIKDQDSWDSAIGEMRDVHKVDVSKMPGPYDPEFVKRIEGMALSTKDRLEADLKREHYANDAANREEDRAQRRAMFGMNMQDRRDARAEKVEAARQKREFEMSPQGRLQKLNSGDKARYDNSTLGLQSIQSMDNALVSGDNTFSLVGDNDFTLNLDRAAEAFGRMQSGGAINKDEEARFKRMAPTATDSKAVQRTKLQKMQQLYVDRLKTLGFTPDEAGVPVTEIAYGRNEQAPPVQYDAMDDAEVTRLYNERVKGTKNAKSR